MVSDSYDVAILGGGNAGFGLATHKAGSKVALVEERITTGSIHGIGG
jgi:pyruvate/2-oxoglutarate dehydrogenase complex dihydrolipoamide dehydrogenase (E3) component